MQSFRMTFRVFYYSMSFQAPFSTWIPHAIIAVSNAVESNLTRPKASASNPNALFPLDVTCHVSRLMFQPQNYHGNRDFNGIPKPS